MPASPDLLREVSAVHEASHVAAAIELDIPVSDVSIDRNDPHRPGATELELIFSRRLASRYCVMLLAGKEGERLYFKEPLPEGTDYEDLKLVEMVLLEGLPAYIEQADGSFVHRRTTLPSKIARLRRRAYDLVRKPDVRWDIEVLRLCLLTRGKLSAEFIDTLRLRHGVASPRDRRPRRAV